MGVCYIVGAGEFFGNFKVHKDDLVIAADGGFDTLLKLGIKPDIIIGDMDSTKCVPNIERLVFPVRKNETDTHLAYLEGVKRGYEFFELYGCVGGRDDHTFANYSLLFYAKSNNHTVKLVGKVCDVYALKNETVSIRGKAGKHFSAFAYGGEAKGVSIRGFEYECENINLTTDFPLAVSNMFTDNDCEISVIDGELLIMIER